MSAVMKIIFSLSLSGSLLILVLFFSKPLLKNRFSRQWQYYIWLVVIARLLLPIAPETSIIGVLFTNSNQMNRTEHVALQDLDVSAFENDAAQVFVMDEDSVIQYQELGQNDDKTSMNGNFIHRDSIAESSIKSIKEKLLQNLWIPWLMVASLLLLRKVTLYQSFVRYVKAGYREVADTDLLDRLAQIGEQTGVRRPVELYVNGLVSSPLLIGFIRPCIILPTAELTKEDFTYTIWHELIHYKRKDVLYKWLVQFTVSLHWFNPLVWLMGREINCSCEFSCDEAVLGALGGEERRAYGDTLFRAMEAGGSLKEFPVSVSLSESAELLKERLGAIMDFRKRSGLITTISIVFTVVILMGATAMGAYVEPVRMANIETVMTRSTPRQPAQMENLNSGNKNIQNTNAKNQDTPDNNIENRVIGNQSITDQNIESQSIKDEKTEKSLEDLAEQYYEKDMLPQFGAVFAALDESSQRKWLDTVYVAGESSFFSAAVYRLDDNSPLIAEYAEKAYADGEVDFFSVLTGQMSADLLQSWRDRAKEGDMDISFQCMLMDSDDLNQWKLKVEQEDAIQYQQWGITRDGQNFYYQNQLVRVFFDEYDKEQVIRTLQWNPAGTVDVKVTRSFRNQILSVEYMTAEEVKALFGSEDVSDWNFEEDYETGEEEKEEEIDPKNDVCRMTVEQLPKEVCDLMKDNGEIRTWYVYHAKGRQYLCCRGFAWSYGYQPTYDEDGWRINIQRFQKKEYGDVLLALPDNGPIMVYCDGQEVALTEIEK